MLKKKILVIFNSDLFQEIQGWECSNTKLKYEIHLLQKELKSLSKIWTEHAGQCESVVLKKKRHRKHKKTASQAPSATVTSATCSEQPASSEQTVAMPILVQ